MVMGRRSMLRWQGRWGILFLFVLRQTKDVHAFDASFVSATRTTTTSSTTLSSSLRDKHRLFLPRNKRRQRRTSQFFIILLLRNQLGDNDDNENNNNKDDEKEDDSLQFLESFRQAVNTELGTPLPSNDFTTQASQQAAHEFQQAMREAQQELANAKLEANGNIDQAIDQVLGKLTEAEAMVEQLERDVKQINRGDDDEYHDDNEMDASFQ